MPNDINSKFETDGYIGCLDVLDTSESLRLQENFGILEKEAGKAASEYSFHNIHLKHQWVYQIATHRNTIDPVKAILGPNIILLDSRFICKYPVKETQDTSDDEEAYVAWHQDVSNYVNCPPELADLFLWKTQQHNIMSVVAAGIGGIDGTVITAWLAVDDADVENGCMQVIPGTHKKGIVEHRAASKSGNLLSANQSIPLEHINQPLSTPCPVKAGQMSLHHGLLIHGSEPNKSRRRRCGYVIRFVSTSAKPIEDSDRPRSFPCTVVVSGEDSYNNFLNNKLEWH